MHLREMPLLGLHGPDPGGGRDAEGSRDFIKPSVCKSWNMRPRDLQIFLYDFIRQLRKRWDPSFKERKVLDIGSGHRPHPDATHLVDLYLKDDTERGKKLKRLGKYLIQANIETLPFKDKVFEYIYASHVLEHT